MPRRGEYTRGYPSIAVEQRPADVTRIGRREVVSLDDQGEPRTAWLDPHRFTCSNLAAQLADEWKELCETSEYSYAACRRYRRALIDFCTFVDQTVAHADQAALSSASPDLVHAVTEWTRGLPARHTAGSREPGHHANSLRRLVDRRAQHPDRVVTANFDGWLTGASGLRRGKTQEVDEFSRADKKRIIAAAWADLRALEQRLNRGRELAAAGVDPRSGGWLAPANLLWGIAREAVSTEEIARYLPQGGWPLELSELLQGEPNPFDPKRRLINDLVRMLYLHNDDLHAFRILLMAGTNRASEEITGLTEDDVEFQPGGVLLTFTKDRAHKVSRASFSTPTGADVSLHTRTPRLDVAWLLRRLMAVTAPLAQRAGLSPAPLFLRGSMNTYTLVVRRFHGSSAASSFGHWLKRNDVKVGGPPDIRRLRKSGKVEKALTYRGRISDIADDHSEEVFRGHYAHGTTLRVIAGNVITAAQRRWFDRAITGPVVLTEQAEASLEQPDARQQVGLTQQQVQDLRTGALDMGVSSCRDPFESPYGRSGQLCPVAPLRCLECRNAFVLPSNLPQLLLFAEHLERLRQRLPPQHFHAAWGQSHANLRAVLADRTDAEKALARKQITEAGLSLHLPLSAQAEFDS
jgi:hypothetical protein